MIPGGRGANIRPVSSSWLFSRRVDPGLFAAWLVKEIGRAPSLALRALSLPEAA